MEKWHHFQPYAWRIQVGALSIELLWGVSRWQILVGGFLTEGFSLDLVYFRFSSQFVVWSVNFTLWSPMNLTQSNVSFRFIWRSSSWGLADWRVTSSSSEVQILNNDNERLSRRISSIECSAVRLRSTPDTVQAAERTPLNRIAKSFGHQTIATVAQFTSLLPVSCPSNRLSKRPTHIANFERKRFKGLINLKITSVLKR